MYWTYFKIKIKIDLLYTYNKSMNSVQKLFLIQYKITSLKKQLFYIRNETDKETLRKHIRTLENLEKQIKKKNE